MSTDDITWLSLAFSFIAFSIILLLLVMLIRDISHRSKPNSNQDVGFLLSDLLQQISSVQRQVIDQKVQLEIIEMKGKKNLAVVQMYNSKDQTTSEARKISIENKVRNAEGIQNRLTNLQVEVLNLFSQGAILAVSDVQEKVHRTREHTGREMNSLRKRGYLIRDSASKPFTYKLSDLGEKALVN